MLAFQWRTTLQLSGRPLFLAVVALLIAVTAARTTVKALKPGRTGEQSRTAFLRWRPQIQSLASGTDIYRAFNYPNPPIMALILTPLTQLPPLAGLLTWFGLKVLMAVAMAVMIFRLVPLPPWGQALAVALSLHPILGDLSHGNVNLFVAFLIVAGIACHARRCDFAAGLFLALAIACKITPALFVPYFLWKRAWRTLAGIGVGLCLWWMIVPGAVLGFERNGELLRSWYEVMVRPFAVEGRITSEHPNQSLPGVLTRLLTTEPSFIEYGEEDGRPIAAETHTLINLGPGAVKWIIKAAMIGFGVLMVWVARPKTRGPEFAAECSLIVLGMLLFSERTWKHHATTLLLPLAVLVAAAIADRRLWWCVAAVPVLSLLPSACPEATQNRFLVYGVYTILYLLLLGTIALVLHRSRRADPPGRCLVR